MNQKRQMTKNGVIRVRMSNPRNRRQRLHLTNHLARIRILTYLKTLDNQSNDTMEDYFHRDDKRCFHNGNYSLRRRQTTFIMIDYRDSSL